MTYYSHYNSLPAWGTQQYQFITPPAPSYQPQPSWTGLDFFRAQAGNTFDGALYDQVWPRAQSFTGTGMGAGTGPAEAQYWHRKIYGGLGDIRTMLPTDIGAAAAFEAWRNWQAHNSIYAQPLAGDRERMREALVGLAIGEATRLWQFSSRMADQYGVMQACEIAALTASRLFFESAALSETGGELGMGMGMNGMGMGMAGSGIGGGLGMGGMGMGGMGMLPGGISPRLSPSLSAGSGFAGGMGFPGLAASNTSGGILPPAFSRRRSSSMGAAGAPMGLGLVGASAGMVLPRAVTPIPGARMAGMGLGAGANMGGVGLPYAGSGYGSRMGMGMGAGIPLSPGGLGAGAVAGYPYSASDGSYALGAGGLQSGFQQPIFNPPRSRSSHRSRHGDGRRSRSHEERRRRRHRMEDELAYGAGYALGGHHGAGGYGAGGYGSAVGNAATGYATGNYGGVGGGYGAGGYAGGYRG